MYQACRFSSQDQYISALSCVLVKCYSVLERHFYQLFDQQHSKFCHPCRHTQQQKVTFGDSRISTETSKYSKYQVYRDMYDQFWPCSELTRHKPVLFWRPVLFPLVTCHIQIHAFKKQNKLIGTCLNILYVCFEFYSGNELKFWIT